MQKNPNTTEELLSRLRELETELDRLRESEKECRYSEQQLLEAKLRYEQLLAFTPAVIYSAEPFANYSTTFVSSNVKEILGYEPEEFLSEPKFWADHIHPDDLPHILTRMPDSLERGYFSHEYRFKHKSGSYIWVRDELRLVRDLQGRPREIIGYLIDITERKAAEELLIEERNRAQEYLDVAGVAILIIDKDETVRMINRRGREILGYEENEIVGRNWFDSFLPGRTSEEVRAFFHKIMNGELPLAEYYINPVLTKTGAERMMAWHNALLADEKGNATGALSSGEDITERERAGEALKESEANYRAIFETANDAIFVHCIETGQIFDVNHRACEMFGFSPEEARNSKVQDFIAEIPPYPRKTAFGLWKKAVQGEPQIVEWLASGKNGRQFWVEVSMTHAVIGRKDRLISIVRDITERKKAEEEREKLQNRLQHSQKMEAIGTLAGGIAHDFNNFLTAIEGYASLAMMQIDETSPIYRDLKQVLYSTGRAADLTRQLLVFSRRQTTRPRPLNINDLVGSTLKLLKRLIGEDIEIVTLLEPHPWIIQADEGNIEQVMMNLAVNARDAMPEGGRLTIKTENLVLDEQSAAGIPEGFPGNFIHLSVEDTGVGMTEDVLQHIFEPFFTTKEPEKGAGLGLSVVYGIVRQHRGFIQVETEPGRGSRFRIYLPSFSYGFEQKPEKEIDIAAVQGKGERILLVEDEGTVREFASTALEANGYTVFAAGNAREASELFDSERAGFDLILIDVVLPDRSGLILADDFLRRSPDLKILFTSGYPDHKAQMERIRARKSGFLEKPYSLPQLLQTVKNALTAPHSAEIS